MTTQEAILQALATIRDPDLGRDIVSLGLIKDLKVSDENISFSIELTTPACPVRDQTKEEARRAVPSLPGIKNVDVTLTSKVRGPKSEETSSCLWRKTSCRWPAARAGSESPLSARTWQSLFRGLAPVWD